MVAPPGHWLLGHIPAIRRDPLGLLAQCTGKVVPLRLGKTVWLVVDAPDVKHVLEQSESVYTKGRAFRFGRQLYGNSLLVTEGETHRRQVKQIGGLFFRYAARSFLQPAVEITDRWLDRWGQYDAFDLWDSLIELTLAISSRAVFGSHFQPDWLSGRGEADADSILHAYDIAMAYVAQQNFSLLPLPDWLPTPANRRYAGAISVLNRAFFSSVERHRSGDFAGGFLDHLLSAHQEDPEGFPMEQVRDQALVLMLGGYESTATALCWTVLLLSIHDEIREQLQAEICQVFTDLPEASHVRQLRWTSQVFSESLRLYPPPWLIPRTAAAADTLPCGHRFNAGNSLFLSPWRTHRDPRYFANPTRFDPDRFSPVRNAQIVPGSYFPFGLGPRHCLAESIACQQAALILATIFRRAEFRLLTKLPAPQPLLTLRPRLPVPVRIDFIRD